MGNSGSSKIDDIGDVILETKEGGPLRLKDVRHVSDFRYNLLSTRNLDDEGLVSTLGGGKWKLCKGSLIMARGKKCCSLYKMQAKFVVPSVNTVEGESSIELWHKRLGMLVRKV